MKKIIKRYSVYHIEEKMELQKFNCFFVDFLKYSFRRTKIISTVKIVYKKTGECYIKWQRVTTSGTTSDNNDNEWYNQWQEVTTSGTRGDSKWYNERQRMTTSDNEWERLVQRMTRNDNEWPRWKRVTISANFSFFQIREELTAKHTDENSLKVN